jgi:hypothetical protein
MFQSFCSRNLQVAPVSRRLKPAATTAYHCYGILEAFYS